MIFDGRQRRRADCDEHKSQNSQVRIGFKRHTKLK